MLFTKYISILIGILSCYYFIVILFDLLKSDTNAVQVTTQTVQFDKTEKPIVISDEDGQNTNRINSVADANVKRYLPPETNPDERGTRRYSPIVDLGLEILSGEPFTVNAENLLKFMIA